MNSDTNTSENKRETPAVESVITIGNFDGVHLGHRRILATARALADRVGAAVAAVTFEPHPLALIDPARVPLRLSEPAARDEALRRAGADLVIVIETTRAMLDMTPHEFLLYVADQVRPIGVVEGADFQFGRGRSGDVRVLRQLGGELGFEVAVVDPVTVELPGLGCQRVSSSLIRRLLGEGRVQDAAACLGEDYRLEGTVVRGRGVGVRLGYPTANLDCGRALIPADGIYAAAASGPRLPGECPAAVFIGSCSTFGRSERVVEAHLPADGERPLDAGDLYDAPLTLRLLSRLRGGETFPTAELLQAAIRKDIADTLAAAAAVGVQPPTA